ncbi:MAG: BatA domain-containing protein, partial [Phycisphaerales bacterium]
MNFLSPWSAMAAAGVVVPLLLLLYFLKLRRQLLRIPTTLLWRESTQDLQVNVPFQRLRPSLLLFLQLLLLATLLAALAQPVLQTEAP